MTDPTADPQATLDTIREIIMRADHPLGLRTAMIAVILEPDTEAPKIAEMVGACVRQIKRGRAAVRAMAKPRRRRGRA